MNAELNLKAHCLVGDVRLFGTSLLAELNDTVVCQQLQVVMNVVDVPIETLSKRTDTVGWSLHDGLEEFHPTICEKAPQLRRVLEVDDVGNVFAILPAFDSVERRRLCLLGWKRGDTKRRGIVSGVAVRDECLVCVCSWSSVGSGGIDFVHLGEELLGKVAKTTVGQRVRCRRLLCVCGGSLRPYGTGVIVTVVWFGGIFSEERCLRA